MFNIAVIDIPIRISIKLAKLIEYNFNYKATAIDYFSLSAGRLNTRNYNVFFLNIPSNSNTTLKFLEKLRNNDDTKNCHIILLSSHFQKDLILEALKFGITDIIFKPYDFDKINEQLKSIFDKISINKQLDADYWNKSVDEETYTSPEIETIKQKYLLLIKDILRQEFRTKIKSEIKFRSSNYDNFENAVVYKALYKSSNNKIYESSLVSTYDDILFLFSKLKNVKVDVWNYDILKLCDEFTQTLFNRILLLLKNVFPNLQKIQTKYEFYNNFNSFNNNNLLLKFCTEDNNNFILEFKELDN